MTDLELARRYIGKAASSKDRGIVFSLSFTSYKNLMRAKYCKYTGIALTDPRPNKPMRLTDRTIDRIDSSKGYVKGNVVAVANCANKFKALFECDTPMLPVCKAKKILNLLEN